MAQQEGWVEAYELLDDGCELPPELLAIIKSNRNPLKESFLHWYALEGEVRVFKKIIELGLDLNTQNKFGNTPLMECALIDRWDMVELLLAHGADPEIKNNDNENAIESLRNNYSKVKSLKLSSMINLLKNSD
ncbi:MAG: ankyrin repeat domain-containing protein [Gammaproteobacteria bacterium]